MLKRDPGLLGLKVPLVFADGSKVYQKLAKNYKRHKKGLFILAPSGAGKTHYIREQKQKDWIDGDNLWEAAKAHPKGPWWLESLETNDEIDQRSDVVTVEAKKLGFWIMGSCNYWLKPDAIVIPNWNTHKKYILFREKNNYDGGATSDKFAQVLRHRKRIQLWTKKGVPMFDSVEKAVKFLTKK